ncbi:MAG: hypothetical protein Q9160_002910 [Pyrenula sp. 1 TL-2023]
MGSRLESNSTSVRKRIESHSFENEEGEEYESSKFGGFADYFRRKKIKLQNLDSAIRSSSTDKPQIFKGVVAHVNGYTQPSLNDLHTLVVSHGGGFMQYLDGKTTVTHIIASHLTPKKKVEFQRYRIVKPAWVVESIEAGRLLPWENYRVVDEGVGQKILGFDNGRMTSQTNSQQQGYRNDSSTSWYTSQVKDAAKAISENQGNVDAGELRDVDAIPDSNVEPTLEVPEQFSSGQLAELESAAQGTASADPGSLTSRTFAADKPVFGLGQVSYPSDSEDRGSASKSEEDNTDRINQAASPDAPHENAQLTAEEHNARLLSDPRMRKSSTMNPDFLQQYYRESRLHHLSTWKAELKAQLQAATQEKFLSQKDHHKRKPGARRYVMHVDFDSFFAAVSLRKHPQLIEKPVVIAHGSGPGSEIASCNYPARKYGVKNGMWMKTAKELCSGLEVLPYDFKAYEEASRHFYDAILGTDGIVQSVSIDEALVDVSTQCLRVGGSDGREVQEGSIYREQTEADGIAQHVRDLVQEKTSCAVSVGIGNNILLAKVALRKAKPAGQYQIKPEEALSILGELTVQDLPGVAYSIGGKLEEIGVKYVKDIRELTKDRLISTLGPKTGEKIWDYSRGIDRMEVGEQVVRKSVSAEVNWGIRFVTQAQADEFIHGLCEELQRRLIENNVKGKQLTMKIMRRSPDAPMDPPKNLGHGKCDTFNKSVILGVSTNTKEILAKEALSILKGFGFSPGELRGLGVQMTKLEPLKQLPIAAALESSQRRLQFKQTTPTTKEVSDATPDPIIDSESPRKELSTSASLVSAAISADRPETKPLNILGTQFVIPSQVDPEVLSELPPDIRSKLQPQQKDISNHFTRRSSPKIQSGSRPQTPDVSHDLPSQSQLDPETLEELPEDVRNELLAYYKSNNNAQGQQVLPQSPRKPIPAPKKKINVTPTKKRTLTAFSTRGRGAKAPDFGGSTLTQSNFISVSKASTSALGPSERVSDVSDEFLAALPPDIRREVLDQQKRERLKQRSGLNLGTGRKKFTTHAHRQDEPALPGGQRKLQLPPRPERPTFTSKKLSSIQDLREAMTQWVGEFKDEGPWDEDADALISYLKRVVIEEKDMEKAVSVVKWVSWLVTEEVNGQDTVTPETRRSWADVCELMRQGVQSAVQSRGLQPIEFE